MKPKALAKWQQHPGLFDRDALLAARTCTSSTTPSPRRCTALPAPTTTGRGVGQAAPGRIRMPGAGAQCAQRPLRARGALPTAARGRPLRDAVAAAAWRPRGLPGGPFPGACAAMPQAVVAGWRRTADRGVAASARRAPDRRSHRCGNIGPMDDIVEAALRKWPNVPHCHGWLALDARGDWYMRDDRIQAAGPFPRSRAAASGTTSCASSSTATTPPTPKAPGSSRTARSASTSNSRPRPGCGASSAPTAARGCTLHTGRQARPRSAWLDDRGRLFLDTDIGFGIVHSLDMGDAADAVESGPVDARSPWPSSRCRRASASSAAPRPQGA
jgi:hypothetical protein